MWLEMIKCRTSKSAGHGRLASRKLAKRDRRSEGCIMNIDSKRLQREPDEVIAQDNH